MQKDHSKQSDEVSTSKHVTRFVLIGIAITIFNFVFYTLLVNVIFKDNNFLWLAILISTTVSTFVAYSLHSRITWKERPITKTAIHKFFIWNLLAAFVLNPILTQLFSLITPLYQLGFNISESIHLPLSFDDIQSTGAFVLTSCVTMILNFLFYDKFVFGKSKSNHSTESNHED